MFGTDEDDTDFLSPTGGAKLASLFGLDQVVSSQGNESFQYTAPKQPKKGQPAAGQKPQKPAAQAQSSVLSATAVHVYRFASGQYVKQGKFGAAVLGNHSTKEYKILLYVSQQQPVTTARIHPGFVFTVQASNYSTFYDDQRQNWSIMFETEKAATDFSKQVCIAKSNSFPSLESVLCQDLIFGEGQASETGDSMEVAYTGWLLQNNEIGQVFDSNLGKDKLLRLKLGSGKVIKGWEDGMVGMRKGGRRLLIIPPALAYGSSGVAGRIPPDSTLVFEVEIKRVKFVKDSGSDKQSIGSQDSAAPSPVPGSDNLSSEVSFPPPTSVLPKPGEPALRVKSNSISEQLANPDMAKAKLISRMARMGQPMLPFLAGGSAPLLDSSDSEIEDPNTQRGTTPPVGQAPVRPIPQFSHAIPPQVTHSVSQPPVSGLQTSSAALLQVATLQPQPTIPGNAPAFQPYTGMSYAYQPGAASTSQLQAVAQMYPPQLQQAPQFQASGDVTSFLMTEARQHNTEIRMAVSKVADKMDLLSCKLDELQKQNIGSSMLLPSISCVTMETSMIMNNIQRIIQENERLKHEVFEKSNRIEEQNEKISELIQRNQRYVEQSNLMMEKRNDTLISSTENTQARVLYAEQAKHALAVDRCWDQAKVAEDLAAATAQVSRLQLELTGHQKKEMELRSQLTNTQQDADNRGKQLCLLQTQLTELQEISDHAQSRFKAEKQSHRQLDMKVTTLEEEVLDLRVEKENLEKTLAERKKKSQLDRQQAEEEMEEIRKSYQEELEKLRQLLKRARTSTDQVAAEQASLLQAELESQWQSKCDRMLASAKEQHIRQLQEACEQRDSLQQKLTQLEEKLSAFKEARDVETQRHSTLQEKAEQLETLQEKYAGLQTRTTALKEHYEEQVKELEKKIISTNISTEQTVSQTQDTTEEVKKIMNGVFQSLRGEFDLEESYSGRGILGIIMSTIKTVTLQLLDVQPPKAQPETSSSSEEEEEDQEEEAEHGLQEEECKIPPQANGDAEYNVLKMQPESSEQNGEVMETKQIKEATIRTSLERVGGPSCAEQLFQEVSSSHPNLRSEEELQPQMLQSIEVLCHDAPNPNIPPFAMDNGLHPPNSKEVPDLVASVQRECTNVLPTEDPLEASQAKDELIQPLAEDPIQEKLEATIPTENVTNHYPAEEDDKDLEEESKPEAPPPLGSDEDDECLGIQVKDGLEKDIHASDEISWVEKHIDVEEKPQGQIQNSSTKESSSSFIGDEDSDEDDLFKTATPKPLKPTPILKLDEDDEEEVSLKGHPPPAPLFGDDEDDEDLDWLG
ncbi:FK506-binding protein 15 isoform X2 [Ambystoma mexicanum]|uniref:FK506-binding protein 15 isoform X2 n=1 Tax=Ambystoma mexicanum TaxID=8296 RepID=UPI0037E96379